MTLKQRIHNAVDLESFKHALEEYSDHGGKLVGMSDVPQWFGYRDIFPFQSESEFNTILEQAMAVTIAAEGLKLEIIHPLLQS